MFKEKLFSSLIAGLILCFSAGCGNQDDLTLTPIQSFDNMNIYSKTIKNTQQITFATYNVKNFFDGVPMPGGPSETAKPYKEVRALGDSIRKISADVIALQEIDSLSNLTKFRDKYLTGLNYTPVLIPGNDERGINVAVLSRFPVTGVISHKDDRFPVPGKPDLEGFNRDFLQVGIKVNENYNFTLFVAHLKSQNGGAEADAKRRAESIRANEIIRDFEKKNPRSNYIIAGDLNDVADSQDIQPLVDPRASGLNVFDIILDDLGNGPDVYTYYPKEYRSRIDYILVSLGMFGEYIEKSVKIHKESQVFIDASDHLPVTAKFDVSVDN